MKMINFQIDRYKQNYRNDFPQENGSDIASFKSKYTVP